METSVTLHLMQKHTLVISKIELQSIHDMEKALSFESKRLVSLIERGIGIPTMDTRYWDSKRKITIRKPDAVEVDLT